MPPHYAISEAFIVIAALYCAWKLTRNSQWIGALGVLLFGAAASIGVYRFPSGQVAELASIHRWAGQIGGLAGMGLIGIEFLTKAAPKTKSSVLKWGFLIILLAMVLTANVKTALAVPFFLLWSIITIAAAFALPAGSILRRLGFAAIASIMLLNVIFIRQSNSLSQDMSWHIFHMLIAIWVFGIYCMLTWQTKTR
ncbi:MAG: hypothetical protein ABJN69_12510 [Hellea sp.]